MAGRCALGAVCVSLLGGGAMAARVLVVEDDANERAGLELMLPSADYRTEFAASGAAALRIANDRPPDVVLTDLVMPDLDGIELLGRLRAFLGGIPVIVFTGHVNVDTAIRALRAGAAD